MYFGSRFSRLSCSWRSLPPGAHGLLASRVSFSLPGARQRSLPKESWSVPAEFAQPRRGTRMRELGKAMTYMLTARELLDLALLRMKRLAADFFEGKDRALIR